MRRLTITLATACAVLAAVEAGDTAAVRRVVGQYNRQHATWGWKRPASLHHIADLHATLRNPHYVVVFRDLFAIANRNRISMGANLLANMQRGRIGCRRTMSRSSVRSICPIHRAGASISMILTAT